MRVQILGAVFLAAMAMGESLRVDFTRPDQGWQRNKDTEDVKTTADGLAFRCIGGDPFVMSMHPYQVAEFPADAKKSFLTLETAPNEAGGTYQLYYCYPGGGMNEEQTVALSPTGKAPYSRYVANLPAAAFSGKRVLLRFDPPDGMKAGVLKSFAIESSSPLLSPRFETPPRVALADDAVTIPCGEGRFLHAPARWNCWAVEVFGKRVAESNPDEKWYAAGKDGKAFALDWSKAKVEYHTEGSALTIRALLTLEDGTVARATRVFSAVPNRRGLRVSTRYDGPHRLVSAPWFTVLAGRDTAGHKRQALFPGVEYLGDEPSSNEKEIRGPQANRLMPAPFRICYPLMTVVLSNVWVAVTWDVSQTDASPIFDTPDRVFQSGGHLMGLWSPAVGAGRNESDLDIYPSPAPMPASCEAVLWVGHGGNVTDVLAATGRFDLPKSIGDPMGEDAVELLSYGWLDSGLKEGLKWRHAVAGGDRFGPMVARDVPGYLLWLAAATTNSALAARLTQTANEAIAATAAGQPCDGGVSHVNDPAGVLLYGDITNYVRQSANVVRDTAKSCADGTRAYVPDKVDYASTLGTNQCNGYTAMAAEGMLKRATWTGDESAIRAALAVLDKMAANYSGTIPRGAQPWEMPLHTPDILASARLCRCFLYGYLLRHSPEDLEQARYWAETGFTMVYLDDPVRQDGAHVGPYATTGVIGATGWVAPNWIGRPVQWCGLVYSAALAHLARAEEDPYYRTLWGLTARNIAYSGLQQTHPKSDGPLGGLLPDSFNLVLQYRYGPDINPGTLEANIAATSDRPLYTVSRLPQGGLIHVPGALLSSKENEHTIRAWPQAPYWVAITRARMPKEVLLTENGAAKASLPFSYFRECRTLLVRMPAGNNKPQTISVSK
jgi:hypothetical protein